jgi:hypothetical protein
MARTKTTAAQQLENSIRSRSWYNFIKSELGVATNYRIANKIGDNQGSKWAGYEGLMTPSSTTVVNVDLSCPGSLKTFREGPDESKLFICMFSNLEELGVFTGEDTQGLLDEYTLLNRGSPFSLKNLTKNDFNEITHSLSSMNVPSSELLAFFGVHILLLRLFIKRSKFVNSSSQTTEIILKMTLTLLAKEGLVARLKFYGIYLFACDWLLKLSEGWFAADSELDVTITLNEFTQDPSSLIFELNKAIFIKELTEDPSGKYGLSAEERSLIF